MRRLGDKGEKTFKDVNIIKMFFFNGLIVRDHIRVKIGVFAA